MYRGVAPPSSIFIPSLTIKMRTLWLAVVLVVSVFIAASESICPGVVLVQVEKPNGLFQTIAIRSSSGSTSNVWHPVTLFDDCSGKIVANENYICCIKQNMDVLQCKNLSLVLSGSDDSNARVSDSMANLRNAATYSLALNNQFMYTVGNALIMDSFLGGYTATVSWDRQSHAAHGYSRQRGTPVSYVYRNATGDAAFYQVYHGPTAVNGSTSLPATDGVARISYLATSGDYLYGLADNHGGIWARDHYSADMPTFFTALPTSKRPARLYDSSHACTHLLAYFDTPEQRLVWLNNNTLFDDETTDSVFNNTIFQIPTGERLSSVVHVYTPSPSKSCTSPEPLPHGTFTCDPDLDVWIAREGLSTNESISVFGPVTIAGNLTIGSNIIRLSGKGSSIEVLNCIVYQGNKTLTIEIVLSEADLSSGKYTALLLHSNCSNTDLSDAQLVLKTDRPKKKCESVDISKSTSSTTTSLAALVSISKTSCNTWWIILVSVLAAVILLTIILIVLLATFNNSCKSRIRPFRARKHMESPSDVQ